jgi:hypothetical protein
MNSPTDADGTILRVRFVNPAHSARSATMHNFHARTQSSVWDWFLPESSRCEQALALVNRDADLPRAFADTGALILLWVVALSGIVAAFWV